MPIQEELQMLRLLLRLMGLLKGETSGPPLDPESDSSGEIIIKGG